MKQRLRELSNSVADYIKAAWYTSGNKVTQYPKGLYKTIRCRIQCGIGPRFYSLFRLDEVAERLWPEYLVDEHLRPILRKVNSPELRKIVSDKELFFEHCVDNNIPTIPILLSLDTKENYTATSRHQLLTRAGNLENDLFFKQTFGTWGSNSFIARQNSGRWEYCNRSGTIEDIITYCSLPIHGRQSLWIAQPVLQVHKDILTITSQCGLSTVRAISFYERGTVSVLFAMLRITVGNNVTDNFSQGRTGNMVAPVDLSTGRLGQCKGSSNRHFPEIRIFEVHPDTRNKIEGFRLPYWDEVKAAIVLAHSSLPYLNTLAWDVAITDTGPVIVEANPTYDVSGMQVAHRRGLKKELFEQLNRNTKRS